jgi:transposase
MLIYFIDYESIKYINVMEEKMATGTDNDKRIAALMYETGKSQKKIAEFFGVAQSTVSLWIREGKYIIEKEKYIQNTETYILQEKMKIIEKNYKTQIENLIKLAAILSPNELYKKREFIELEHENQIQGLIENK